MIDVAQFHLVIMGALLLVALGFGLRVFYKIFREARTRRYERQTGDVERYTEDEEYGQISLAAVDEADSTPSRTTCRKCGAENDAAFRYCRRCTTPL